MILATFWYATLSVLIGRLTGSVLGSHDELLRTKSEDVIKMLRSIPPASEFGFHDSNAKPKWPLVSVRDDEVNLSDTMFSPSDFLDPGNEILENPGGEGIHKFMYPTQPGQLYSQFVQPKGWNIFAGSGTEENGGLVDQKGLLRQESYYGINNSVAVDVSPGGQNVQSIAPGITTSDQIFHKRQKLGEGSSGKLGYILVGHYNNLQGYSGTSTENTFKSNVNLSSSSHWNRYDMPMTGPSIVYPDKHGMESMFTGSPETNSMDFHGSNHLVSNKDETLGFSTRKPRPPPPITSKEHTTQRSSFSSQFLWNHDSYTGSKRTSNLSPHPGHQKFEYTSPDVLGVHITNGLERKEHNLKGPFPLHVSEGCTVQDSIRFSDDLQRLEEFLHGDLETIEEQTHLPNIVNNHIHVSDNESFLQNEIEQAPMNEQVHNHIGIIETKLKNYIDHLFNHESSSRVVETLKNTQNILQKTTHDDVPGPESCSSDPQVQADYEILHAPQTDPKIDAISGPLSHPGKNPCVNFKKGVKSVGDPKKSGLNVPRKKKVIQRRFMTSCFKPVLYNQGLLNMGNIEGFSDKISTFLENLYQQIIYHNVDSQAGSIYKLQSHKELQKAFEATKFLIVKHFFGGLHLVHKMNEECISKEQLMEEGMCFLFDNFQNWAKIPHESINFFTKFRPEVRGNHSVTHETLLHYVIELSRGRKWSYTTMVELLKKFSNYLIRKFPHLGIQFDSTKFTEECHALLNYMENEESWAKFGWKGSTLAVSLQRITLQGEAYNPMEMVGRRNVTGGKAKDVFEIVRLGGVLISNLKMIHDISSYFSTLENLWKSRCIDVIPGTTLGTQRISNLPQGKEEKYTISEMETMIENAINIAQTKITMAFMYIVNSYHQHTQPFPTLEKTLLEGWKFLSKYFSTWPQVKFLHEIPRRAHKTVGHPSGFSMDWSNTREVVHYFLTEDAKHTPHCTFARYLAQLWDIHVVSQSNQTPIKT